MQTLHVVDYKATKASEKKMNTWLKRFGANVSDWYRKDYGLVLLVQVPDSNVSAFKGVVNDSRDFSYDV